MLRKFVLTSDEGGAEHDRHHRSVSLDARPDDPLSTLDNSQSSQRNASRKNSGSSPSAPKKHGGGFFSEVTEWNGMEWIGTPRARMEWNGMK